MYRFSKMGNWLSPSTMNFTRLQQKVRKALFVNGSPLMKVGGQYYWRNMVKECKGLPKLRFTRTAF